jgi:hypothetical protein
MILSLFALNSDWSWEIESKNLMVKVFIKINSTPVKIV